MHGMDGRESATSMGCEQGIAMELMKYTTSSNYYRYRFDFEIGRLVNSPCKNCERQDEFPKCADDCRTLDRIHTALVGAVSCSRRV